MIYEYIDINIFEKMIKHRPYYRQIKVEIKSQYIL